MIATVLALSRCIKGKAQCFFGYHRWLYSYRELKEIQGSGVEAHCQRCPYWEFRPTKEAVRSYERYGHTAFYDIDGRTVGADTRPGG